MVSIDDFVYFVSSTGKFNQGWMIGPQEVLESLYFMLKFFIIFFVLFSQVITGIFIHLVSALRI